MIDQLDLGALGFSGSVTYLYSYFSLRTRVKVRSGPEPLGTIGGAQVRLDQRTTAMKRLGVAKGLEDGHMKYHEYMLMCYTHPTAELCLSG